MKNKSNQPPKVGDMVELDNKSWVVVSVMVRLTPFKRAGQDTKIEGYTLGLQKKEN